MGCVRTAVASSSYETVSSGRMTTRRSPDRCAQAHSRTLAVQNLTVVLSGTASRTLTTTETRLDGASDKQYSENTMTSTLTLHYTYGLPGSGKTTLARDFIKRSNRPITRVNRDDIRFMLYGSYWGKGVNEGRVTEVQHEMIKSALASGYDVFADDTNLSTQALGGLMGICMTTGATLERHDLSHIPPWECIANDAKRDRQVGAKVIWDMWERYLKPEHPGDPSLPHAVLFDVDGTLALHGGRRGPFEWHRVGEDDPNKMVVELARMFAKDYQILIVSGRDGVCRPQTKQWLIDNDIPFNAVFMRPEGDSRKDSIVKLEILEEIKRSYFPALCVDDRQQVVDAYRFVGLPVWQVARGDF